MGEINELYRYWEQHYDRIFRQIMRKVVNEAVAEDLTQEVFILSQRHFPKFNGKSQISSWIYRIAENAVRGYFRSAYFNRALRSVEMGSIEDSADFSGDGVEACTLLNEVFALAEEILDNRQIEFLVRAANREKYGDISRSENIPVSTVKTIVHRARKRLASNL